MADQPPDNQLWLDDRAVAAAVYILYLIALGTVFTAPIGWVLASQARPQGTTGTSPLHLPDSDGPDWLGLRRRGVIPTLVWVGYLGDIYGA